MNEKINTDLKSIKYIYERNKAYLLPYVIIFSCVILFFQFIVPQFKILLLAGEQAKEASKKSETLKENLNVLTNINENSLDLQLKVLNQALPLSKDFGGILNSIYFASQKSGVGLGAFSLQIGDLYKSEANVKFPTISLNVPVNANTLGVNSFVEIISKTLPLSEITQIKIREKSSAVNLSFYYKLLGDSNNKEDIRIVPISQKGLSLIDKLRGFENVSSNSPQAVPITSPSGEITNPF